MTSRRDSFCGRVLGEHRQYPGDGDVGDDRGQFSEHGREGFVELVGQASGLLDLPVQSVGNALECREFRWRTVGCLGTFDHGIASHRVAFGFVGLTLGA